MRSRQIPPRQGRQGFKGLLITGSLIIAVAVFTRSIITGIVGLVLLILAEGVSRPPQNGPHEFVTQEKKRGKRDEDERVLVCLGDSLTHGACSANWVDDVVSSLTKQLENDSKPTTTLKVVNAGQNGICTHTVLNEKVNHVVACHPDYIFIMIGSNDAMAIYREDWAREKIFTWNLTEKPTEDVLIRNLTDTVKALLDQTTAVIAIATLPPFGETVDSASNIIIQGINTRIKTLAYLFSGEKKRVSVIDVNSALWDEINSQRIRKNTKATHSIDMFLPYAFVMGILHFVFGLSWNVVTRLSGNVVLSESLHLNEDGGSILRNEVVKWLMDNVT